MTGPPPQPSDLCLTTAHLSPSHLPLNQMKKEINSRRCSLEERISFIILNLVVAERLNCKPSSVTDFWMHLLILQLMFQYSICSRRVTLQKKGDLVWFGNKNREKGWAVKKWMFCFLLILTPDNMLFTFYLTFILTLFQVQKCSHCFLFWMFCSSSFFEVGLTGFVLYIIVYVYRIYVAYWRHRGLKKWWIFWYVHMDLFYIIISFFLIAGLTKGSRIGEAKGLNTIS